MATNRPYDNLDPQDAETYAKLIAQIRSETEKLSQLNKNLIKGDKIQVELIEDQKKKVDELRARYRKYIQELKDSNSVVQTQIDGLSSIAQTIKGMPEMYEEFKEGLNESLSIAGKVGISLRNIKDENIKEMVSEFSSGLQDSFVNLSDIAQLNKEDKEELYFKSQQLKSQYDYLTKLLPFIKESTELTLEQKKQFDESLSRLQKMTIEAGKFANQTKEYKEIYGEIIEDVKRIGGTFRKVAAGIELFLSSARNRLGLIAIGIGEIATEFGEVNKELGVSIGQMFALSSQATLLGMILGEEAKSAVIDLAKDLGNAHHVTTAMAVDAALLAHNYGLSGQQVGFLSTAFGELQGLSYQTGKNTFAYVKQLSLANDIAPAQVMKDVAENTEFFATYSRDGGKNIGEAAVAAARLGTNLGTVAKVADHLLDYQTSVADEMEASVLLGREFNLSKARELIFNGKIEEGMKAALEAAGGIHAFAEMDPYQRMLTAKALGVSVGELQQMIAHEENLNGMHGIGNKLYSQTEEILQAIGNSLGGKIMSGLGAVIIGIGQWNMAMAGTNFQAGALIKKFFTLIGLSGSFVSNLFKSKGAKAIDAALGKGLSEKQIASGLGGKEARDAMQKKIASGYVPKSKAELLEATKTKTKDLASPMQGTDSVKGKTDSLGKINYTNLLKAAAAMLIIAGAIFVLGKALQEFNTVQPESLLKMAGALVAVGLAMWGLSAIFKSPVMATGLGVATLGMLGFGAAIFLVGQGIKAFSEGLSVITNVLPKLFSNFLPLVSLIMPIFGLAAAIGALSLSLATLSVTGLAALPVLAALGFAAGAGAAVFGGEEKSSDDLLKEIKGLRSDLAGGKLQMVMDGKVVAYSQNKRSLNDGTG